MLCSRTVHSVLEVGAKSHHNEIRLAEKEQWEDRASQSSWVRSSWAISGCQSAGQEGARIAVASPSGKNMDGPVPPLALVPQVCLLGEAHPIRGKGGVGQGLGGQ